MAGFESRHGAPLPVAELFTHVRRLNAWAPGKAARYAAFYVRRREAETSFEATVEAEGRPFRLQFGRRVRQAPDLREPLMLAAAVVVACSVSVLGVTSALDARHRAELALSRGEQLAERQAALARRMVQRQRQLRELRAMAGAARDLDRVVEDLAWVANARTADARIVAVHWEHGLVAVESRGEAPPLAASGRTLERSAEPIRRGVWLWGVDMRPKS